MPDWITEAGLSVIVLWIVVDRLVPRLLEFAKKKSDNTNNGSVGSSATRHEMRLDHHDKDIKRIEVKLDAQNTLLNEMNGNIIALQTLMQQK